MDNGKETGVSLPCKLSSVHAMRPATEDRESILICYAAVSKISETEWLINASTHTPGQVLRAGYTTGYPRWCLPSCCLVIAPLQ